MLADYELFLFTLNEALSGNAFNKQPQEDKKLQFIVIMKVAV
jgi:hypothetical protein